VLDFNYGSRWHAAFMLMDHMNTKLGAITVAKLKAAEPCCWASLLKHALTLLTRLYLCSHSISVLASEP